MRNSSRTARAIVMALSLALGAFMAGGYFLSSQAPERKGADSYKSLETVAQAFQIIQTRYVEPVNARRLGEQAYRSMVEDLDSYGSYLDAAEAKAWNPAAPEAQPGMLVLKRGGYAVVAGVRPGGPAAKAGVKAGHFLRAVDGRSTRTMTLHQIRLALDGEPGSSVKVALRSPWETGETTLELRRESEPPVTWSAERQRDGSLVLTPSSCGPGMAEALRARLSALPSCGGDALALDLRGLTCLDFEESLAAAGIFMEAQETARLRTQEGETVLHADAKALCRPARLAVLMDNSTGGGPEILAAALKSLPFARTFGARSLGMARAQELVMLPSGAALWLSTKEYLAPGGAELEGKGLTPDQKVKDDEKTPEDEILAAARQWLGEPEKASPETAKEAA